MVGRAALANPRIFSELKVQGLAKGQVEGPGPTEEEKSSAVRLRPSTFALFRRHLDYLLAFREQLAAHFPDDHIPSPDAFASVKMHVHLFRYFNGRPGAAELRRRLNTVRTLAEIESVVSEFKMV